MKEIKTDFEKYYGLLIAMTYRMIGSFIDAEDIVQEVAIEWINVNKNTIENPKAWLVRVCTNKCLDHLKKVYKKREVYTGTWLPEMLPESLLYWEDELDKKESLNVSFLLLLENLNPKERAVFILKHVFEYNFNEISSFTSLTIANCRKIFQRANEKILELENRNKKGITSKSLKNVEEFFRAACRGDNDRLNELLAKDSEFFSDGGGKVSAASKVITSNSKVSRFFSNIFKNLGHLKYEYMQVNGMPGVIVSKQEQNNLWKVETVFSFEMEKNEIVRIFAQRNPDKLAFVHSFLNRGKY